MKLILILLFSTLLFGSATDKIKFEFHGNFCGAQFPFILASSKDDELKELKKIPSIDIIDKSCKSHDICYSQNKLSKKQCDLNLIDNIKSYQNKLKDNSCKRLSDIIIYYFYIKHKSPISILVHKKDIKKLPLEIMNTSGKTLLIGTQIGMNYGFEKPSKLLFHKNNFKSFKNDVLYIYPPEKYKCEID